MILLTIGYDGTNYGGWQRQKNADTVQERLETALCGLYGEPVTVVGASRTDAGVHALGQRVGFSAPHGKVPLNKLPMVLNGKLPDDISVFKAENVEIEGFHPIFSAKRKTYRYEIYNDFEMNPLRRRYACHCPTLPYFSEMNRAVAHFRGRHDFSAFCAAGSTAKNFTREIYHIDLARDDAVITLEITGNGFLYNMVRIIAGTLIYVGLGKISESDIPSIIASGNRENAGKTAPPQGLTLMRVEY